MANLLDYLRWRGDLPFTADAINEVDGLILSQLSMLHWENGLKDGESGTLEALFPAMNKQPVSVGFTADDDAKLLQLVASCARYRDILVCDYAHEFDADTEMQFAAVTLCLPDGARFVSFRGTDSTIVGWKEDCNMAFSKPVPAQEAARAYLERAAEAAPGALYVGGHSKGGNLAVYAASTVSDAVLARVVAVYDNDGPGLSDRIDAAARYARIGDRLHSFVPQSSVVGMLLAHPNTYEVVKSDSISVLQHNPYSWQVEGPRFVHLPELNRDSVRFEAAFRKWLSEVDEDQRSVLIENLFDVLSATDAQHFGKDFWQALARNPMALFRAIQGISPDSRRQIGQLFMELANAALHPGDDEP